MIIRTTDVSTMHFIINEGWTDKGDKIKIKEGMTLLNLFQLHEHKGSSSCVAGPPISTVHSLFITLRSKSQA